MAQNAKSPKREKPKRPRVKLKDRQPLAKKSDRREQPREKITLSKLFEHAITLPKAEIGKSAHEDKSINAQAPRYRSTMRKLGRRGIILLHTPTTTLGVILPPKRWRGTIKKDTIEIVKTKPAKSPRKKSEVISETPSRRAARTPQRKTLGMGRIRQKRTPVARRVVDLSGADGVAGRTRKKVVAPEIPYDLPVLKGRVRKPKLAISSSTSAEVTTGEVTPGITAKLKRKKKESVPAKVTKARKVGRVSRFKQGITLPSVPSVLMKLQAQTNNPKDVESAKYAESPVKRNLESSRIPISRLLTSDLDVSSPNTQEVQLIKLVHRDEHDSGKELPITEQSEMDTANSTKHDNGEILISNNDAKSQLLANGSEPTGELEKSGDNESSVKTTEVNEIAPNKDLRLRSARNRKNTPRATEQGKSTKIKESLRRGEPGTAPEVIAEAEVLTEPEEGLEAGQRSKTEKSLISEVSDEREKVTGPNESTPVDSVDAQPSQESAAVPQQRRRRRFKHYERSRNRVIINPSSESEDTSQVSMSLLDEDVASQQVEVVPNGSVDYTNLETLMLEELLRDKELLEAQRPIVIEDDVSLRGSRGRNGGRNSDPYVTATSEPESTATSVGEPDPKSQTETVNSQPPLPLVSESHTTNEKANAMDSDSDLIEIDGLNFDFPTDENRRKKRVRLNQKRRSLTRKAYREHIRNPTTHDDDLVQQESLTLPTTQLAGAATEPPEASDKQVALVEPVEDVENSRRASEKSTKGFDFQGDELFVPLSLSSDNIRPLSSGDQRVVGPYIPIANSQDLQVWASQITESPLFKRHATVVSSDAAIRSSQSSPPPKTSQLSQSTQTHSPASNRATDSSGAHIVIPNSSFSGAEISQSISDTGMVVNSSQNSRFGKAPSPPRKSQGTQTPLRVLTTQIFPQTEILPIVLPTVQVSVKPKRRKIMLIPFTNVPKSRKEPAKSIAQQLREKFRAAGNEFKGFGADSFYD